MGTNETNVRTGVANDGSTFDSVRNFSYRYESRMMYIPQLLGSHDYENSSFNWMVGASILKRSRAFLETRVY